jgi:hypothetical protein
MVVGQDFLLMGCLLVCWVITSGSFLQIHRIT